MKRAICLTFLASFLATAAVAATQTVDVVSFSFSPSPATINIGDTVTWNFVQAFHSTTSDSTTGPETWDSGVIVTSGATFSHTFMVPGTYPYYCSVHSFPGGTFMNGVVIVNPGPATHFAVSAPASAATNSAFSFTVTALDAFNNTASGYSDTVHFTTTDGSATLPANSTLTSGVGTFSATLRTAGSQTLTATDTTVMSVTGTSNTIAVSAGAATHFAVSTPASATAGVAFSFTVTALDASNTTASGYSGTVHFTSSDGAAVLPADATLTGGVGTFSATLKTAGSQTIAATDTVSSAITGSAAVSVSVAIPTLSDRALLALVAFLVAAALMAIRATRAD